jgi:hypothetical protein
MNWLRRFLRVFDRWRRATPPSEPFPDSWGAILRRDVSFYHRLSPEQRVRLRRSVQEFIATKRFWGSENLSITDQMQVLIAAYACLLLLEIPEVGLYPRTREVIVYPHNFGKTIEAIGPDGRHYHIQERHAGQAWYRGPVLLAWGHIAPATTRRARYNVIIHEFAHQLDFLDGLANGTPPLGPSACLADWVPVFTAEYEALIAAARRGERTLLDPYGATNPAECFAGATEHFFERPHGLRERHPRLYEQLGCFYRQDPAAWPE